MRELVDWLLGLASRRSITGPVVSIGLGVALVPAGLWLYLHAAGPGRVWPIMLGLSALGVMFVGLGVAAFVGNAGRMAAALRADGDVPHRGKRSEGRDAARVAAVPFGACADCQAVIENAPDLGRCPECLSVLGWVHVPTEDLRGRAVANLSGS